MWSSLKNYSDGATLAVRVVLGLLFLDLHAWPSLRLALDAVLHPGKHHGIAAFVIHPIFSIAEALACILIIIGLWTRPAALLLGLVVLFFSTNGLHSFDLHHVGEREIALLLLFVMLFFGGAGKYSFDKT